MARKILLADDSVTAQNMGRKILADAGYEVIAVNNGSAALKKIAELKPDLVVLDVYMPGYSGLEVCQRLKESHETERIPVLLTVGKLEPFKPEEAQRVRAEAFIVKPFEASELLSTLSKLEDKVVPRPEPSRPGRFARAFAAAEESGRVRAGEEDGWKSRISFPHEKTEAEEKAEKSELQASIYNPVNRDLRTIVETSQEKAQGRVHQQDEEEKLEAPGRDSETVDLAALAPSGVPSAGLPKDVTQEEVAAIAAAAAQIQIATAAIQEDEQRPSETASQVGPQSLLETVEAVGFEPPMREIDLEAAAPPILEKRAAASESEAPDSQDSQVSDSQDSKESQDVPVTMAATAETVASSDGASRWKAVAVALEGDEAGLLLEHEMQKASEAAEVSRADSAANAVYDSSLNSGEFNVEAPGPEASQEFAKEPEPAPAALVASVEPSSSAVPEPDSVETMTSPSVAEQAINSVQTESALEQHTERSDTEPGAQDVPIEAAAETNRSDELAATSQTEASECASQPSAESQVSVPASNVETVPDYSIAPQLAEPEPVAETTESASSYRAFHSPEFANEPGRASEPETQSAPDSETVKNTAAAWASWRQIRDAGKAAENSHELDAPEPAIVEATAAAVAAGAEQALPSAASSEQIENPSDVASIVDSVLADLRPKLMQEISRKMAEKK